MVKDKTANPYREGSVIWELMEGNWEGMTSDQIAKKLVCKRSAVYYYVHLIKKKTGYHVKYAKRQPGRRKQFL